MHSFIHRCTYNVDQPIYKFFVCRIHLFCFICNVFNIKIATIIIYYLVTTETHIPTIFMRSGHKLENIISGSYHLKYIGNTTSG